jgi:hypothetical protein
MIGDVDVQKMKLVDLNQAPYNPRRITDEAFGGLGASLEEFGLLSLIIWNKRTGNIVGGHQRYKKLVEMGETETDVVVVDLDNNDEVALNIMLNNSQSRGDYTSDVKVMLEKIEVQVGSVFNNIKLNDLYDRIKENCKESKPREPREQDDSGGDGTYIAPDYNNHDDNHDEEYNDVAVIVCPSCKSIWRMSDEKVLKNNVKENSEQVDG